MATSLVFLFVALAQNSDADRLIPTLGLQATPAFVLSLKARGPMRVPAVATTSMRDPMSGFAPAVSSYNRIGSLSRTAVPMTSNQLRTVRMAARMAADADDAEALEISKSLSPSQRKAIDKLLDQIPQAGAVEITISWPDAEGGAGSEPPEKTLSVTEALEILKSLSPSQRKAIDKLLDQIPQEGAAEITIPWPDAEGGAGSQTPVKTLSVAEALEILKSVSPSQRKAIDKLLDQIPQEGADEITIPWPDAKGGAGSQPPEKTLSVAEALEISKSLSLLQRKAIDKLLDQIPQAGAVEITIPWPDAEAGPGSEPLEKTPSVAEAL